MDDEIAGYRFKDARLLSAALTHSSYAPEQPDKELVENFERLEFLGDGVVDFVVADELYHRYPQASEGELTERRAQTVSRVSLADVGEHLGLMERARLGKGAGKGEPRHGFTTRLFESVVGAIYLDGGFAAAQSFVRNTLGELLERPLRRSAKSQLQELTQERFGMTPEYVQLEAAEPGMPSHFTYEARIQDRTARGGGRSMRAAQEEAAAKLLEEFTDDR